jgi:membrane associated rhomboid family serine protease
MALFGSFWDDFRYAMRTGNTVTRLVIINFIVFVLVNVCYLLVFLILGYNRELMYEVFHKGLDWFCMPGNLKTLVWQPWSVITSIFLHQGIFHLINNLIGLYLFGSIVSDLIGDRKILPTYLLGGLTGNIIYLISAHFFPHIGGYALGASGAVMALAGTALILAPDYRVALILLGEVKVKYIVFVMLLLDFVGIANQENTGGHAAHLGGFLMGCLLIYQLRDGKDWADRVNRLLDRFLGIFSKTTRRKPIPQRRRQPAFRATKGGAAPEAVSDSGPSISFQERLDAILDKIKENGYENLTQEEKDFLFEASKR